MLSLMMEGKSFKLVFLLCVVISVYGHVLHAQNSSPDFFILLREIYLINKLHSAE